MATATEKDVARDSLHTSCEPTSTTDEAGSVESAGFDAKSTRRLVRKIDFFLIPFLSLLYLYALGKRSVLLTSAETWQDELSRPQQRRQCSFGWATGGSGAEGA